MEKSSKEEIGTNTTTNKTSTNFYSLYLLGAGEGNTKRRAKVQIQCKTQIQKVENHYRNSHLRTLDFLYLLELTLAKTNTNTSSASDQNMSTVSVLVTFFEVLPQNVHIKSTFTWDCNATVFF